MLFYCRGSYLFEESLFLNLSIHGTFFCLRKLRNYRRRFWTVIPIIRIQGNKRIQCYERDVGVLVLLKLLSRWRGGDAQPDSRWTGLRRWRLFFLAPHPENISHIPELSEMTSVC